MAKSKNKSKTEAAPEHTFAISDQVRQPSRSEHQRHLSFTIVDLSKDGKLAKIEYRSEERPTISDVVLVSELQPVKF